MLQGEDLDEHKVRSTETTLSSLMAAAIEQRGLEDNAQSILEEHVSRIWDNSAQQTPSRSPGRHTPLSKSPERAYRKLLSPGYMASPVTYSKACKRKEKDYISLVSYDSGVSEPTHHHGVGYTDHGHHSDYPPCQTPHCKHVHHYHHHHHVKSMDSGTGAVVQCSAACYGGQDENCTAGPANKQLQLQQMGQQKRLAGSGSGKKMSDSGSNVYDSGVSVAYDRSPPISVPNILHPTNEKYVFYLHYLLFSLLNSLGQKAPGHRQFFRGFLAPIPALLKG